MFEENMLFLGLSHLSGYRYIQGLFSAHISVMVFVTVSAGYTAAAALAGAATVLEMTKAGRSAMEARKAERLGKAIGIFHKMVIFLGDYN